ncbi:MAG: SEC-C domain-containing protein, partial [Treponema sp.]|nr:SEC-C domain-containing protein [Treponema sp.]
MLIRYIISMSTNNDLCPCGSGKKYGECCEPIIR